MTFSFKPNHYWDLLTSRSTHSAAHFTICWSQLSHLKMRTAFPDQAEAGLWLFIEAEPPQRVHVIAVRSFAAGLSNLGIRNSSACGRRGDRAPLLGSSHGQTVAQAVLFGVSLLLGEGHLLNRRQQHLCRMDFASNEAHIGPITDSNPFWAPVTERRDCAPAFTAEEHHHVDPSLHK